MSKRNDQSSRKRGRLEASGDNELLETDTTTASQTTTAAPPVEGAREVGDTWDPSDVLPQAGAGRSQATLEAIAQRMAALYVASEQYSSLVSRPNDARAESGSQVVASYAKVVEGTLELFKNHEAHLTAIATCIVERDVWKEVAQRVLVVGAMLHHGRGDLVQPHAVDAVVTACAAMEENAKAITAAIENFTFRFRLVQPPCEPTLGEMVARMRPNKTIGRRFLAAAYAASSLATRQLVKPETLHEPPPSPFPQPAGSVDLSPPPPSNVFDVLSTEIGGSEPRVIAVSGTSGSGKTIAALEAATRISCTSVSALYMLASDITNISGIDKIDLEAKRDDQVKDAILSAVMKLVAQKPAKRTGEKSTAVIVLDEMGEFPNVVRGVCAARPFAAVAEHLNVDRVVVVVVGTGVDVATNAVGSCADSFIRAHVDSSFVSLSLLRGVAGIAASKLPEAKRYGGTPEASGQEEPVSPLGLLLGECGIWRRALRAAPRLRATLDDMSCNPRMVAALVEYMGKSCTKYQCDPANDLAARLEHGVDYALERFVMLNALAGLDFQLLLAVFSRAFAISLDAGVATRRFDKNTALVLWKFGLVADLAVWCKKDDPTSARPLNRRIGDAVKTCDGVEYVLCLPKGRTHRYEMSPAMAALSFRLFGRRYPQWSGDGFERTLAEYLSWVGLAAHSGVPITIPDVDPLARLKRVLVSMGLGAEEGVTLWRVVLERHVTTVEAAAKVLTEHVVATKGRHLVVALNKPLAPFADILIGLVEFEGGAATLRSMVLIQAKHHSGNSGSTLRTVLPPEDCYCELAKMGQVSEKTTISTALVALDKDKDTGRCASALLRLGYGAESLSTWRAKKDKAGEPKRSLRDLLKKLLSKKLQEPSASRPVWNKDPSKMVEVAELYPINATEVNEVAVALGYDADKGHLEVSPPDGCESDSPKIPKTAWFIVLRSPGTESMEKDVAHPKELLWFNDMTARAAFSPSSLGRFFVVKQREIAPLNLRPFAGEETDHATKSQ